MCGLRRNREAKAPASPDGINQCEHTASALNAFAKARAKKQRNEGSARSFERKAPEARSFKSWPACNGSSPNGSADLDLVSLNRSAGHSIARLSGGARTSTSKSSDTLRAKSRT